MKKIVCLNLDTADIEKLNSICKSLGISKSGYIRLLIRKGGLAFNKKTDYNCIQ